MRGWFLLSLLGATTLTGCWLTPDQQAQRRFDQGKYREAAELFRSPMRQGMAWYRAGEFKKAEQAFAGLASAEAEFNRGNSLVFQGKYENAAARYRRALELRPGWEDAQHNLDLAITRGEALKKEGGDMGDQKLGADDVKFDKNKKPGGQDTQVETSVSNASMQALWLRRVQTKPAEFLKAKFAFQLSDQESSEPREAEE